MAFRTFSDQGRLNADPGCIYNGNVLQVQTKGKPQTVDLPDPDQFAREMDWMANVVLGRSPMVSPGEEGLQDMRLMHAILESLRQGGAPVQTNFGYRRAVDPAAVVGVTSPV
jgi:glucose-fructose oxidoreductase